MEEHVKNGEIAEPSPRSEAMDQIGSSYISTARPAAILLPPNLNDPSFYLDDEEERENNESRMTDEDAQSLIGPSISLVATRLRSPNTPAVEKAAAMEELDGGGLFESDSDGISPDEEVGEPDMTTVKGFSKPVGIQDVEAEKALPQPEKPDGGLSLGRLPSPNLEESQVPTPWHAGPKPMVSKPSNSTPQSSLQGVFSGPRTRSLSGGAEALRRLLPKGLPSMSQVGNMFGSTSSHQKHKSVGYSDAAKRSENGVFFRSGNSSSSGSGVSPPLASPQATTFEPIHAARPQMQARLNTPARGPPRPKNLRRVTSDDSLLYHSLSRTSSLGDDTRFEHQQDQVNSRVKAIRDSLQDRSGFRMPQMPSMPKILPGNIVRKNPPSIASPLVAPAMASAAVSGPEAATENVRSMTDGPSSNHLDRAMEHLTGDIVIMGGYRGSILRSARTKRQLWIPVKVGLNIRKVNLEVGLEPEDEERMEEHTYASGMLQNIGPVDISRRLFKRLRECENARTGKLRVWDYGYDWRLSPALLARKLTEFLEKLPSNMPTKDGKPNPNPGAMVVAHSLGGLITRHVVNHRPELFCGVVYAGVPQACVNILGPIRNGDAVLLSSRVLTAQVNFTLRTSFVLLPEDGHCFIDINTGEKYYVDFFDVNQWVKYRWTPCLDPPLPPRNPQPAGGFGGILKSGSLLTLPISGKRGSSASLNSLQKSENNKSAPAGKSSPPQSPTTKTTRLADTIRGAEGGTDRTLAPQMGNIPNPVSKGQNTSQSISTTVTIPREKALTYLTRVLAETKKFKQELHFRPALSTANLYPPLALIYGKSIPTLYGAKVDGREGIPCSDSYDNLAFASGDGVCLAKQAMLPDGYKVVHGGRISSDRGHVTLLGDLNAVGRALEAVLKGRRKGIGLGLEGEKGI